MIQKIKPAIPIIFNYSIYSRNKSNEETPCNPSRGKFQQYRMNDQIQSNKLPTAKKEEKKRIPSLNQTFDSQDSNFPLLHTHTARILVNPNETIKSEITDRHPSN